MYKNKEGSRRYYLKNKERMLAKNKEWKHKNFERYSKTARAYKLKRFFGLSLSDYDALVAAQKGVCAICTLPCETGKNLAVDHDHKTGKVRGALCMKCNQAIGLFDDSVDLMQRAIEYLKRVR